MTTQQVISLIIAAAGFIFGLYQYLKKDTKDDAATITTVLISLENIKDITRKIESSLSEIKEDVKTDHDMLIRIDESLRSAWIRINNLERELHQNATEKED